MYVCVHITNQRGHIHMSVGSIVKIEHLFVPTSGCASFFCALNYRRTGKRDTKAGTLIR